MSNIMQKVRDIESEELERLAIKLLLQIRAGIKEKQEFVRNRQRQIDELSMLVERAVSAYEGFDKSELMRLHSEFVKVNTRAAHKFSDRCDVVDDDDDDEIPLKRSPQSTTSANLRRR